MNIDRDAHQQRIHGGKVLEADTLGPKVLLLPNGTMAKIFRRRSGISSDKLYPYSIRFIRNAIKLRSKGVPTLTPIERYRVKSENLDVVIYQPLDGISLKDLSQKNPALITENLVEKLGIYIRNLHDNGVYFRSLHLGNILLTNSKELGLIDIADLKVSSKPLPQRKRLRNFRHLTRMKEGKEPIKRYSETLSKAYASTVNNENILKELRSW